jgi:LPXTG-site transpeptidase (sortase) family protein
MNWKQITDAVLLYKIRFFVVFFVVFTMTYTFLFIVDFLPESPVSANVPAEGLVDELNDTERDLMSESSDVLQSVADQPLNIEIIETDQTDVGVEAVDDSKQDLPVSMYIESLDREITVLNPLSRSIADLDTALLDGVVRHPDSAAPNQDGNVFILGHSSYLPNVFNPNYQAFNGIQNLEWGDTISLASEGVVYTYRVEKVYKAKASDVVVPIANTGKMLTIATCNSFGSTDDRYIVEATLQTQTAV